ncbi:bifunctional diaminohydroxyphosphoribosylaminopyrimidine deaminase/5-amino-6-(5-phosphoribosylamino)uracil reductase RibD [Hyphomonas sp. WL0036]|nr:bifunctional diaminohydroxyphosphoribosylaminopyrimidine deaminase/5-amino-6-(5-phosphoribosylamino)uracil reductase RibD [Hyphomonas sediminis]MBY9065961.1 bifunctional diaminohydroxyphosphoribosylaminopyrimidine deaminase/5-amino-6-(5-phosphoribosylamino)uracil reductase RibD [Hyphomonas sediminis]
MMGRAFALARLNQGLTGQNPSVGCILLDADGHIVGAGVTGTGGRPHAEEIALEEAGTRAKGGTAYVTLEPCRERSSGAPSCANKLVTAGIARVVVAIEDPHPTARDGLRILREAGIRVETGLGKRQAARLYGWFFRATAAG